MGTLPHPQHKTLQMRSVENAELPPVTSTPSPSAAQLIRYTFEVDVGAEVIQTHALFLLCCRGFARAGGVGAFRGIFLSL